jgi:hypothetical protein
MMHLSAQATAHDDMMVNDCGLIAASPDCLMQACDPPLLRCTVLLLLTLRLLLLHVLLMSCRLQALPQFQLQRHILQQGARRHQCQPQMHRNGAGAASRKAPGGPCMPLQQLG